MMNRLDYFIERLEWHLVSDLQPIHIAIGLAKADLAAYDEREEQIHDSCINAISDNYGSGE